MFGSAMSGPRRDRSPLREREDRNGGMRGGERDRPPRRFPDHGDYRDNRGGGPPGRDRSVGRKGRMDRRVYVSNIPFEFRWQELKDLFRNEVGEVAFVEVFTDDNGKSRGCGIIELESNDLVDIALEKMHRFDLNGRKIVVKEDFGVERDRYGRIMGDRGGPRPDPGNGPGGRGPPRSDLGRGGRDMHRGGGGGGYMGEAPAGPPVPPEQKYANTYGLNVSFLESLGIEGPLVNRVFVANLIYSVNEKQLKDVFGLAGKVVSVTINKDREGNSKGHGVVEFEHPVEAVQAISMLNNQMYMDRIISVRMDRVTERPEPASGVRLPPGLSGLGLGLGSNGKPLADVASKLENAAPASAAAPPAPVAAAAAQLGGLPNLAANGAAALGLMGAAPGTAAGFPVGVPTVPGGGPVGVAGLPGLGGAGGLAQLAGAPGLGQLTAPAGLGQVGAGLPMSALAGSLSGVRQDGLNGGSDDLRLGGRGGAGMDLGGRGGAGMDPGRHGGDRNSGRGQYGSGYSPNQAVGYGGGSRGGDGFSDGGDRPRRSRWDNERDRAPPEQNWSRNSSDGWGRSSGGGGTPRGPSRRW